MSNRGGTRCGSDDSVASAASSAPTLTSKRTGSMIGSMRTSRTLFEGKLCNGAELHHSIAPSRWCVTLADLKAFRRIVEEAVISGGIVPTAEDNFNPLDDRIGPKIATVNEQLIVPITAETGQASWALTLHPGGLECDLFVTHCWSEGIYEFIDKVVSSWPSRAKHAYCCMLSNPQNLDIASLIRDPANSPFAKALRSAKQMLVVPNEVCSIYTRIWCVYEAYLAYSWDKLIFTASPPVKGLRSRVCGVMMLFALCVGATVFLLRACHIGSKHDWFLPLYVTLHTLANLCAVAATFSSRLPNLRVINEVGALFCGGMVAVAVTLACESWNFCDHWFLGVPSEGWIVFDTLAALFFAFREADRLSDEQADREAKQLQAGFTGRLQDARASQEQDRMYILEEIGRRGLEDDIEHAIRVLMTAGLSTPSLRAVAAMGVDVSRAGRWSIALVHMVCVVFIAHPLSHAVLGSSCQGALAWVPWFKAAQGIAWITLFSLSCPSERGWSSLFAARAAALPYLLFWLSWVVLVKQSFSTPSNCVPDTLGAFVLAPFMLATSALGLQRVAAIPKVGPTLLRLFLGRGSACAGSAQEVKDSSDEETGSSEEESTAVDSSDGATML